jgi:ABC-type transport system involved in multi-copper enzyme maturation permease subunit|tara:strand:+ start:1678 stop:2541 length:864 start_codon:yes stop_codon:yes gene_type:complete
MPVYQRAYHGFEGEITGAMHCALVIARYAVTDLFRSRLFVAWLVVCLVPPLLAMCTIYLRYNLEVLAQLDLSLDELMTIDARFFVAFVQAPQSVLVSLMILFIGPAMVAPDLRNNALPLYLSRPLSRADYMVGKMLALTGLGSAVTWVPGLLLVFFQAFLAEDGWLLQNLRIPFAIVASSLVCILTLSILALAMSAWVKWTSGARLYLFVLIFVGAAFGEAIHAVFGGWVGDVFDLFRLYIASVVSLFGLGVDVGTPGWAALVSLLGISSIATVLLARCIRGYEVVS